MTFDTKQAYKALAEHGFSEDQADGLTELLQEALASNVANLATKDDILLLKAELKLLEQRMTIKLGGLLIIAIGIMTAIQQLVGS